jgi:hypothetical protein
MRKESGEEKLSPHAPEIRRRGLLRLRPDPVKHGPTAIGDSFSPPVSSRGAKLHYRAGGGDVKGLISLQTTVFSHLPKTKSNQTRTARIDISAHIPIQAPISPPCQ